MVYLLRTSCGELVYLCIYGGDIVSTGVIKVAILLGVFLTGSFWGEVGKLK